MKLFTNKKLIQKMTIVLVILMLFNFIIPNYSKANFVDDVMENIGEILVKGVTELAKFLGDAAISILQKMFIGTDPFKESGSSSRPNIALSPGKIFSGRIYLLNIDFISKKNVTTTTSTNTNTNSIDYEAMKKEKWYKDYKSAVETINKSWEDSATLKNGEQRYALQLLQEEVGTFESVVQAVNQMEKWYKEMDGIYGENTFYDTIWPDESNFAGMDKDKVKEYFEEWVKKFKLGTSVREYGEYKKENDTSIFDVSKEENSPAYVLHDVISTWYRIMRNIALIFLLSVLVYVGIRIMLSSTAADNTKYKKMLTDWVVALCILFTLHYMMAFMVGVTQLITDAFMGEDISQTGENQITLTSPDKIMSTIRDKVTSGGLTGLGFVIIYIVLIFYTVYFLFYYVKRVVYIAFLTLIAPLVSLTYPIDKMGDSKAQAFEMWVREYLMTVLVQPIHLLIYITMISSSMELAATNPIYAIVVMGAMIPAEKFIKDMFGLNSQKGPKGGFLAGAATMGLAQKLGNQKPPKFGHQPGQSSSKDTSSKEEKTKKPNMYGERNAQLSKAFTDKPGKKDSSNGSVGSNIKSNRSTENAPGVDNGDFKDFRSSSNKNDSVSNPQQDEAENSFYNNEQLKYGGTIDSLTPPSEDEVNKYFEDNSPKEYNGNSLDSIDQPSDKEMDEYYNTNAAKNYNTGNMDGSADNTINQNLKTQTSNDNNLNDGVKNTYNNEPMMETEKADNELKSAEIIAGQQKQNTKKGKNKETDDSQKKKSIKGRAALATAGHYWRKNVNWENAGKVGRKLGRGVLKAGLGAVAAGTGATIGLAAGLVTGDPSKAWQYATAGGVAGAKFGGNFVGDGIANLAGGAWDGAKGIRNTYKEQYNELAQYDEEAKKEQRKEESRKFAHSRSTASTIRKKMKLSMTDEQDKEKFKEVRKFVEEASNHGMNDLDTMINAYKLTQGEDAFGNKVNALDKEQAMFVGSIAEQYKYDPENASNRKSTMENVQYIFAENYKDKGMNEVDAGKAGKEEAKGVMPYLDMVKGIEGKQAYSTQKQEKIKKAYDKSEEDERTSHNEKVKSIARKKIEEQN